MIATMLYASVIGVLLAAAASITERVFAHLGWARRGIWIGALLASFAIPAYSLMTRAAPASAIERAAPEALREAPAPRQQDGAADAGDDAAFGSGWAELVSWAESIDWRLWGASRLTSWPQWRTLDRPLMVLWASSTIGTLALFGIVSLALARAMRRSPVVELDGTLVRVSEKLGPAVLGFAAPRIVVPRWLLEAPAQVRAVVLRHEREHVVAHDHVVVVAALLLVALAPWNLALWWQLRRLRFAIEIDCDARVTRGGTDAVAYAQVLLAVRQHCSGTSFAAVALTEPVSQLERRIRVVLRTSARARPAAMTILALLASGLFAAACTVAPPQSDGGDGARPGSTLPRAAGGALRVEGERVLFIVDVSAGMASRTAEQRERAMNRPAAERRSAPKWRQVAETFALLTDQVAPGTEFQVVTFAGEARSLLGGGSGTWQRATRESVERAQRGLADEIVPDGPSDLRTAFEAASALQPPPDNIYVLTDGLPSAPSNADAEEPARRFNQAVDAAPAGVPVNVILFPKEGEPAAAPAFWWLAFHSGGSLVALAPAAGEDRRSAADSDHLVFVVDTSGSMRQYGWKTVVGHIEATIAAHPDVVGIQFVTDEGEYLLADYAGRWIPNDAVGRRAALDALAEWSAYSNSDPREGLVAAIEALHTPDKRIGVYVYGDDLPHGSVDAVTGMLGAIDRANRVEATGERKVRINAVAVPIYLQVTGGELLSAAGYAALMREVAQRNGGTFVALASL